MYTNILISIDTESELEICESIYMYILTNEYIYIHICMYYMHVYKYGFVKVSVHVITD